MSGVVELVCERFGDTGPELVILHGLFGSARNWRTHARELAKGARVTVVDLRNHGQSPHADEMSYEAMAADVLAFLEREHLQDATLLGHSMGGKALMTMALRNPQLMPKLIILDIAPVTYPPRFQEILDGLQRLPVAAIKSRGEADKLLAQSVRLASMRTFLLTNLVRDGSGFGWRVNLPAIVAGMAAIEGFAAAAAGPSNAEVLFLRGAQSNYVDGVGREAIAKLFPEARVESIENAGHWIHADQPAALIKRLQIELTR